MTRTELTFKTSCNVRVGAVGDTPQWAGLRSGRDRQSSTPIPAVWGWPRPVRDFQAINDPRFSAAGLPRPRWRASLILECLTHGWLALVWGFEAIACFAGGPRIPCCAARGWVAGNCMRVTQLARRVNMTPLSLEGAEHSEADETIRLQTPRKAAAGRGGVCE